MQRTLSSSHLKIPILLALLATYIILFYLIFTHQYRLDFSSLYSACQALCSHENPYRVLFTTYFPIVKKLPANLNPPFVLWLFTPFTKLNYDTAVIVWSILSFVLGLIGAGIAFNYAFSKDFLKKNKLYLYLIYLASFATIIDTAIAQLGALLLFLIMSGYHFYRQHNDYAAGILWGVAISIKLFPALLFFYALIQKRYRVCAGLAMVFLLSLLITFLIYGPPIYHHYFSMMRRVLWYGDSWNASIYGMIFRLFIDTSKAYNLAQIHLLYGALFAAFFIFYIKQLREIENKHLLQL
jgi:alpha-1,2-mannosyltransferase